MSDDSRAVDSAERSSATVAGAPSETSVRPGEALPPDVGPKDRKTVRILVVDDERTLRESCASILEGEGYRVDTAAQPNEALDRILRTKPDVILVDLFMEEMSGLEIMKRALALNSQALVVVMTGNPSIASSLDAMRNGAWNYLPKPFSATHLIILVGRAAHAVMVARESRDRRERRDAEEGHSSKITLLGKSPTFQKVIEAARQVAGTDASVFITGESGTGKELIAQFIHENSRRSSREMVTVNSAAIPESLLESEMFGHVEGAFTGAVREKKGLLEVAHGGTLFLDELTEMPHSVQAKLLRVIQDGVVRRVGSNKIDAVVDIRFIAATNIDPNEAVQSGKLRRDLFFRLQVFPVDIPPLRERPHDVPVLAQHFLDFFWGKHREADQPHPVFSGEALNVMKRRAWLGNVRELRNAMERAVVTLPPGKEIGEGDLDFLDDVRLVESPEAQGLESLFRLNEDYHSARNHVLEEFERQYLQHIITRARGSISKAAELAGVDRTTLYRLMDKLGTNRYELLQDGG